MLIDWIQQEVFKDPNRALFTKGSKTRKPGAQQERQGSNTGPGQKGHVLTEAKGRTACPPGALPRVLREDRQAQAPSRAQAALLRTLCATRGTDKPSSSLTPTARSP